MQQEMLHLPGYRVNDYQLVLVPHEELRAKILRVKQEFATKYRLPYNPVSRAWLPLVYFTQYQMMEERIMNRLKLVAMAHYPFKVEMRGFGSFPSHTVFIDVPTRAPVQELVRQVRQDTQRLMKFSEEQKPHFISDPHISIGTRLKPWQYEQGWLEYSHRPFSGKFIADSMLLLRKPAGEAGFRPVQKFSFQNLPVNTKQGELFGF
ncbi:MAG: 2'-5' RNA ligase family protein [Chitinophagaceae bacterium]|nr:MAG: 2'-5' RNA ligase family protein [Chitinophagaceae bacterium]